MSQHWMSRHRWSWTPATARTVPTATVPTATGPTGCGRADPAAEHRPRPVLVSQPVLVPPAGPVLLAELVPPAGPVLRRRAGPASQLRLHLRPAARLPPPWPPARIESQPESRAGAPAQVLAPALVQRRAQS